MKQNKSKSIIHTSTEVILESISDGVFTVDETWKIRSFNRAAEKITGITREEAIGRNCSEVFRSNLCGNACVLQQTMETGEPIISKSAYFINADGNKIPISLSTAVLKNEKDKIIGGVESFRDLSEVEALHKQLKMKYQLGDLVSQSPIMHKLYNLIPAIAASPSIVLILGDTGTGKEVFARTIHSLSERNNGPFIAVNCGALPDNLLESELFGYKAGAFTGATKDKPGRFALAKGGTLFLDEIGDVSSTLQVKLLRVLQDQKYEPLGSIKSEKADVRIIAATNKDLVSMVKKGTFREDLYYRVNVAKIELPELAKRKEDIPLLVDEFIEKFNTIMRKSIKGIDTEALSLLMAYNWPGNIRELENIIERTFIICDSNYIKLEDLPNELKLNNDIVSIPSTIKTAHNIIDAKTIKCALERNNYNRLAAAKDLGIHKTTLFRKIKKLGIILPEHDGRNK